MPKAGSYDFPFYDIDSVIERLQLAYDMIRKDEMDRKTVAEVLGMAHRGGAYANLISSMEKYGFIDTGRGLITVTELGKIALFGSDVEKLESRMKAIEKVDLFKELYQTYGKNINENQIRAFLRHTDVDLARMQRLVEQISRVIEKNNQYLREMKDLKKDLPAEFIVNNEQKDGPIIIQFGEAYIKLPKNDMKSLLLAKNTIELLIKTIEEN